MGEVVGGDLLGAECLHAGLFQALGSLFSSEVNQVNWGLAALRLSEHEQGFTVWAKFLFPALCFRANLD